MQLTSLSLALTRAGFMTWTPSALLLEDGTFALLLEDGASKLLLES